MFCVPDVDLLGAPVGEHERVAVRGLLDGICAVLHSNLEDFNSSWILAPPSTSDFGHLYNDLFSSRLEFMISDLSI